MDMTNFNIFSGQFHYFRTNIHVSHKFNSLSFCYRYDKIFDSSDYQLMINPLISLPTTHDMIESIKAFVPYSYSPSPELKEQCIRSICFFRLYLHASVAMPGNSSFCGEREVTALRFNQYYCSSFPFTTK